MWMLCNGIIEGGGWRRAATAGGERSSAAGPAIGGEGPVRLLLALSVGDVDGGAEDAVPGARERGGAVAVPGAAARRTPVPAVVVPEGVAIAHTVEIEIPAEEGLLLEHVARDRHQHREGGVTVQGAPHSDEVAAVAGVRVEARVGRGGEPGQRGRRVDGEV